MTPCFGSLHCTRYTKHAKYINHCYPTKEGEKGPRPSELSYLTFYASTRPAKLTKVGSYLVRRVKRDIAKGRKQYNEVSLAILKELIQTCHRDLNLFSKCIVRILSAILDTRDIDLIDLSCDTFVVFCSYHDGSTLGVDYDFTHEYETLLKKYASFCNYANADDSLALKMQYTGHRAMQAAVTSNALYASNFKNQLSIILPALLETLTLSEKSLNSLPKGQGIVDIRQSAIRSNENLHKDNVVALASQTTGILFSKANGLAVRISLGMLFSYVDRNNLWWPPERIQSLTELVLNTLQPKYRYLLVSEIIQQLDVERAGEDGYMNDKHASLSSTLETVLNATQTPVVGVSVLEVENSLFALLIATIRKYGFHDANTVERHDQGAQYAQVVEKAIYRSVYGLASGTYYQNQLDDMAGYMVPKLRSSTTLTEVDGLNIRDYRRAALLCLERIVDAFEKLLAQEQENSSSTSGQNEPGITLTPNKWTAALGLLIDDDAQTRFAFARLLIRYLEVGTPEPSTILGPYPKHLIRPDDNAAFVNVVQHRMIDWVQREDFNPHDASALYNLGCFILRRFGADATIKSMPLWFKIQDFVKDGVVQLRSRQRAVAAVTVEYIHLVGQYHGIDSLVEYAESIRERRREKNEWTSLPIAQQFSSMPVDNFTCLEEENDSKVTIYMDRYVVVEYLSKEGRLRDEHDTHGLELESMLYVEWGSEAFRKQEQAGRIRLPSFMEEQQQHKPKLAASWAGNEGPTRSGSIDKRAPIKFENLKEALVVSQQQQHQQQQNGSDTSSQSVPGPGTTSNTESSASRRSSASKALRKDINALLADLGSNLPSTHSLVNPPYPG